MGKKQSRHNRGARTGSHESRTTPAEAKDQGQTTVPQDAESPISQETSHKKERRFGHN